MATVIITDSTAYLSEWYIEQESIHIVPLKVHIGEEEFREGIDLTNRYYYQRLREEPIFPHTSQPSAGEFLKIFDSLQDGDEALVILISSKLSGTVQSATVAREMLNASKAGKIHVIDSRSTSIGLAMLLQKACELRKQDYAVAAILNELERIISKAQLFFVVDNLEYLARGGRISHASKYIGNVLQVKPVLYLVNGQIEVFEKIRTRQKAINRIVEELGKILGSVEALSITHVDALEEAQLLAERLKTLYRGEIPLRETGPVIGSHVGPGTVGIGYY